MLFDGRSLAYMQPGSQRDGATFRTEIGLNDAKAKKFISSELLLPMELVVPGLGRSISLRHRVKRGKKQVRRETDIVERCSNCLYVLGKATLSADFEAKSRNLRLAKSEDICGFRSEI